MYNTNFSVTGDYARSKAEDNQGMAAQFKRVWTLDTFFLGSKRSGRPKNRKMVCFYMSALFQHLSIPEPKRVEFVGNSYISFPRRKTFIYA